jgi:hypothetical protein
LAYWPAAARCAFWLLFIGGHNGFILLEGRARWNKLHYGRIVTK